MPQSHMHLEILPGIVSASLRWLSITPAIGISGSLTLFLSPFCRKVLLLLSLSFLSPVLHMTSWMKNETDWPNFVWTISQNILQRPLPQVPMFLPSSRTPNQHLWVLGGPRARTSIPFHYSFCKPNLQSSSKRSSLDLLIVICPPSLTNGEMNFPVISILKKSKRPSSMSYCPNYLMLEGVEEEV